MDCVQEKDKTFFLNFSKYLGMPLHKPHSHVLRRKFICGSSVNIFFFLCFYLFIYCKLCSPKIKSKQCYSLY